MSKKELVKFADIASSLKTVSVNKLVMGADPELFIKRSGRVIGSEKVIKETSRIVEDGVQVELHPMPDRCREVFGNNIASCFAQLSTMISGKKCKVSDDVSVEVSRKQYNSLSEKNKQFGCGISYNAHAIEIVKVEADKYLKRSAGGHMHFGDSNSTEVEKAVLHNPDQFVPILDIMVGNTAVLLDRDSGNIERRKHYGLAGEYRTPVYGIEYRTLSNFWLRGQPLMSLVFGLARQALGVCAMGMDKQLLQLVDMDDIISAINNNDYELAKSNWDKYKEFIVATGACCDISFPIKNTRDVRFFEKLAEDGIDKYFSHDLIANWTKDLSIRGGWRTFMERVEYNAQQAKAKENASCCTS